MSYLSRFIRINWALWGYLSWLGMVRLHWVRPRLFPARKFAGMLEGLGTTFIKFGQGLSLRPDLLPDDYIKALQVPLDRVMPFDTGWRCARSSRRSARQSMNCRVRQATVGRDHTGVCVDDEYWTVHESSGAHVITNPVSATARRALIHVSGSQRPQLRRELRTALDARQFTKHGRWAKPPTPCFRRRTTT
jgi:hypothetical protein